MTLQERLQPSSTYIYPSPSSDTHPHPQPSSSPRQPPTPHSLHANPHAHLHSLSHHHPVYHRSDSMPGHYLPRPSMPARTSTTPAQMNGEFVISNPVGMVHSSARDEEDREELTTKGRKRKRLAKACSACHKNKRRCDGFAPCSNCEFSSRPCLYVNAQGEVIPPPRTRESIVKLEGSIHGSSASLPNGHASKSDKGSNGNGSPDKGDNAPPPPPTPKKDPMGNGAGNGGEKADKQSRGFVDPLDAVDRDTTMSAELVDLFFNHLHPYASMLHAPTFNYRLFLGRTSPILLDAVYALSAHLCTNATFLATLSPSIPTWGRGDIFAERAHHTAKRLIDARAGLTPEEKAADKGTWEETEFVQALFLLSVYYASVRQSSLGLYFLDVAIDILRPASTASLAPPPTHLGLSTIDYLTLLECRNRTFWMLVLHDLCAAANGRPRRLLDHELYNIPLPGDESQWDRWGGGGSSGREGARRDGLAVGTGTWVGDEGQIGELGHVLRVLVVFSDIMTVANNGGPGSDTRGNPAQHEQALKSWALSLPRHLRFDENTLTTSVQNLSSPLHTSSRSAWLFAYMHAVAECGMFYLQATLATNGATWAAQRQSQAVDNIAVILEAIGVRGRESPLMLFPLLVVSNWHDHLRSSAAPPTAQQLLLDERLATWWGEATTDWGFERVTTMDRGPYQTHGHSHSHSHSHSHGHGHGHGHSYSMSSSSRESHRALSPLPPPPPSTSSLGLYGTSPIQHPPDSAESAPSALLQTPSSSTMTFPFSQSTNGGAPSPAGYSTAPPAREIAHSHRFSTTQLPPLRPRANTLASFAAHVPAIRSPSPRLSLSFGEAKDAQRPGLGVSDRVERPRMSLGLSEPRHEIKLPPLPPMDPSPRGRDVLITPGTASAEKGFKFPSFWKEKEKDKDSGAGISTASAKDEESKRGEESGRYHPYTRERGDRVSPVKVSDERERGRGVSPLGRSWDDEVKGGSGSGRGGNGSSTSTSTSVPGPGPVGIAALISAAEEKSREREAGGAVREGGGGGLTTSTRVSV